MLMLVEGGAIAFLLVILAPDPLRVVLPGLLALTVAAVIVGYLLASL